MKAWEIERLFNDDVREKRKAGSGSFHKRGKGVKHGISGALRTPSYYMSNKEKKKLNGEVKVTYMYETIIPLEEFKAQDVETQRNMLTSWRDHYTNEEIKRGLGTSNNPFYKLVEDLGLPKKPRGGSRTRGPRKSKAIIISPQMSFPEVESEPETKKEIETEIVKAMLVSKGLHLNTTEIMM